MGNVTREWEEIRSGSCSKIPKSTAVLITTREVRKKKDLEMDGDAHRMWTAF